MKRLFYFFVLVVFIQSCQPAATSNDSAKDSFQFAFLTDIHLQPERNAPQGFQQAIDTINALNPDFVLTGGDLIMDALGQSYGRADSLYNLYQTACKSLQMPVYNTMGNHELYGIYTSSGADTLHEEYGKKMYEKRLAKRFYSFNHKGWHFVVLDAIGITPDRHYYGFIDPEQIAWLKQDLEASKDLPVIVSLHIPLYTLALQVTDTYATPLDQGAVVTNANEVRNILEQYKVKLVLQGHWHFLEDLYINGIHYVTGGAVSSAWWTGPNHGLEEGFLMVKVQGEDISWNYVDYKWEVK